MGVKHSDRHIAAFSDFKGCIRYFLIRFLFFHQMVALQKLKIFLISSKKLFSYLKYSIFWNFFPSFPHFPDSKGQIEVE